MKIPRIPLSVQFSESYSFLHNSLSQMGISPMCLLAYTQPWRFFHSITHLREMSESYFKKRSELSIEKNSDQDYTVGCAIVMHDLVYDSPISISNDELDSSIAFMKLSTDSRIDRELVRGAILSTKDHLPIEGNWLSALLCELDVEILKSRSLEKLLTYENQIFREYQKYPLSAYVEKRVELLSHFSKIYDNPMLEELSSYVKNKRYRVGIYPGSFNPFHNGHLEILENSEKVLDKVIVAKGINPEKQKSEFVNSGELRLRETRDFSGDLFEFVTSLHNEHSADFFIVRGLRSSADFESLSVQNWFLEKLAMQQMRNFYPTLFFASSSENSNVSSSGIRMLQAMGSKNDIRLANSLVPFGWEESFNTLWERLSLDKNTKW
jgi:cytidyltransferase-like protein